MRKRHLTRHYLPQCISMLISPSQITIRFQFRLFRIEHIFVLFFVFFLSSSSFLGLQNSHAVFSHLKIDTLPEITWWYLTNANVHIVKVTAHREVYGFASIFPYHDFSLSLWLRIDFLLTISEKCKRRCFILIRSGKCLAEYLWLWWEWHDIALIWIVEIALSTIAVEFNGIDERTRTIFSYNY